MNYSMFIQYCHPKAKLKMKKIKIIPAYFSPSIIFTFCVVMDIHIAVC
jgi:hypothetical protein